MGDGAPNRNAVGSLRQLPRPEHAGRVPLYPIRGQRSDHDAWNCGGSPSRVCPVTASREGVPTILSTLQRAVCDPTGGGHYEGMYVLLQ